VRAKPLRWQQQRRQQTVAEHPPHHGVAAGNFGRITS
jgi:hypothetical protein